MTRLTREQHDAAYLRFYSIALEQLLRRRMPVIEQDDICGMSEALTDFHYEADVFAEGLMTDYVMGQHNSSIGLNCFYDLKEATERQEKRQAKEDMMAASAAKALADGKPI